MKRRAWSRRAWFGRGLALLVLALLSFEPLVAFGQASTPPLGQWSPTTNYPISVAGESCVVYSGSVYCIGGFDAKGNDYTNAYYAPLSSSGIGQWASTTPFPVAIDSSSCVAGNAVMYCVGGENSTSVISNVYEAPMTSSGLGAWSQANAYPLTTAAASCFVDSGYVYCVGGFNIIGDETAMAYYSSLSSGVSSWMPTSPYPFAVNSAGCVVQGSYVYCVAGNEESGLPQYPVATVYYALLSSSGIGPWTATTAYPDALSAVSCVLVSGYIYCAGGFNIDELSSDHVYIGTVGSSGVSSWTNSTAYPFPFDVSSCVSATSYLYCIAGRTYAGKQITMSDETYYAELGAAVNQTSTSTSTSTTTTSESVSTSSVSSTSTSTVSTTPTTTSTSSSSASTTTTTSTTPEFSGDALVLTTFAALAAAVVLLRLRPERRGAPSGRR